MKYLFLLVVVLTLFSMSAQAGTPDNSLDQMVKQLQESPYDNALREKIIKQVVKMKSIPVISEEARRSFIIGETLFKQAKGLKAGFEAALAFHKATTLAPWWKDAYWNLAATQQVIGQNTYAKQTLALYAMFNLPASEKRKVQDRIYAIEAQITLADSNVSGGLVGFWQRERLRGTADWVIEDIDGVRKPTYEIQQSGSAYSIKCVTCDLKEWQIWVVRADTGGINFQTRLKTPWSDSGVINYDCKLDDKKLSCLYSDKDGNRQDEVYAKRSVCEIVGGPGITGYFVLCK